MAGPCIPMRPCNHHGSGYPSQNRVLIQLSYTSRYGSAVNEKIN